MVLTNQWYLYSAAIEKLVCDKIIGLGKEKFKKAAIDVPVSRDLSAEERSSGIKPNVGVDESIRISDVVFLNEDWWFELVWPFIKEANAHAGWNYDIRSCESQQLTRYKKGGYYKWHTDGRSDSLSAYNDPSNVHINGYVRKLSLSLLLNDNFEGGDFQIASYLGEKFEAMTPIDLNLSGTVLVFPSFLEHRVTPVIKGTKYSLATWFLGPPFK